jgi:hypothetical protein
LRSGSEHARANTLISVGGMSGSTITLPEISPCLPDRDLHIARTAYYLARLELNVAALLRAKAQRRVR